MIKQEMKKHIKTYIYIYIYINTTQHTLKKEEKTFYILRPEIQKKPCACKTHALPHLARPTLNELQRCQHEKTSLKCVRAQSPTGLALVPCTLNAVYKRRCWLPQTNKQKNSWCILKHHATWISTRNAILYKEPFFPWKTKEKRLALRARAPHY